MDPVRFDALARVLSGSDSRRRVLGLLTAAPVVGGLLDLLTPEETEAKDRRRRRKQRHKQRKHRGGRKKGCRPKSRTTICAGQCGEVKNRQTCGKTIDCGPCTCATGCTDCQVCNPVTNQCDPIANDTPCDDGDLCTVDDVCTDGVCGGSPTCASGQGCVAGVCCLLPAATGATKGLQEAIDGAQSGDTLRLCAGTWEVSSTVRITKNLTLIGAGDEETVLDGGNAVRVLQINPGATVTLQNLTITKGKASIAGGIYNRQADLTLLGVSVSGNTSDGAGGIWNQEGTLTLGAGSRVSGNSAGTGTGGGINNFVGTLTLQSGSSVTGNSAYYGGGIASEEGPVTLQNGSRVSGNTATTNGGGIGFYNGTVTLEPEAHVCDNSAPQCTAYPSTFDGPCPNPSNGICPS